MSETKPPQYRAIDGLRAIAVLAVALYHLDKNLVPGGFVGVDVFFVISGFVVSLSMARVRVASLREFTIHFYARRLYRIAPALVVCLLVTSLLACMFIPQAWLSHTNRSTALAAFFGFSNFVLARSWNDYFAPLAEFNPFTHTWSLGVEEQFYLAFPLLFYYLTSARDRPGRRKAAALSLAALTLVSLAICVWWTVKYAPLAFYLIPPRFWELGLGVALFATMSYWQPWLRSLAAGTTRLLAYALLVALAASMASASELRFPFPWAIAPVLLTCALIALAAACGDELATPLSWPLVVWFGKISYSLYLWHWPVVVLFRWTVGLEGPATRLLAFVLAVGLAALSYRWVETPLRYGWRARGLSRGVAVAGALATIALATALAALVFDNEDRLSLSVTSDSGVWLPNAYAQSAGSRCRIAYRSEGLEGGTVDTFVPQGCQIKPGRLLVLGDSHAAAYNTLLRLHAENTGGEVQVASRPGCGLFNLIRPMSAESKACKQFAETWISQFTKAASASDVLFLPALRIDRFQDQWGAKGLPRNDDAGQRAAAVTEAVALLDEFAARGGHVVFEAPKPLFKAPPFRCSDWFNNANPICAGGFDLKEAEFEARRAAALSSIREVVGHLRGATIWDPSRVLCQGGVCRAFRDGRPLYFDGDHLSGLGNELLYPDFAAMMASLDSQ
jgi:peptidoglycan/LPS O-acetylase OafA/YrhL